MLLGIRLEGTTFGVDCQTIRLPLHGCSWWKNIVECRPLLGALPFSLTFPGAPEPPLRRGPSPVRARGCGAEHMYMYNIINPYS